MVGQHFVSPLCFGFVHLPQSEAHMHNRELPGT